MGRESDSPSRSDSTELAEVLRREGYMGLMRLWGARWGQIRALIQTNAFEDEDDDDDEDENENEASPTDHQAENRTKSAEGAVRRLLFCVSSIWPRLNGGGPAHLARRFRG
jgi:hypothetical protein